MNIQDYTPTRPNSYGYVPEVDLNWDMFPEGYINNTAIEYLVDVFKTLNKNILTYEEACNYWIHNCGIQGIKCTKEDIHITYSFCYGHGCEWEWEE